MSDPAPLCGPCARERDRWLDTTPTGLFPSHGFSHGSGAAYDVTAAGIRDNRRARYERWRRTVNHQRELVADGCRSGRHADGVDT